MAIFGRSKGSILIEAFYKSALEDNKLDELCAVEAGASTADILRESDFKVSSNDHNNKPISKLPKDRYYFNYICYLPGRIIYLHHYLEGEKLLNLFDQSELKDINEQNAAEAINSKIKIIVDSPDLIFHHYNPLFIYYKKIDVCRFLHEDDGTKIQIRVGDFQYLIEYAAFPKDTVENCRSVLLDRDDLRFLQLQISEANL